MAIIETHDLTREFLVHKASGGLRRERAIVRAVDGLSVTIEPGSAIGYIGANGSGKSTTIKMLCGILQPSSGFVKVAGFTPVPQRRQLAAHIGVVFGQRSQLWWDLPLRDSFPVLAAMYRRPESAWRPRLEALTRGLQLDEFLDTPVRQLSLGQRMRGEVAAALLHEPELIILDEPTIGLDMISKEHLRAFLNEERRERGTTLFLTTHDMSDVQRLCDRLLIIDHGRLAFDGTQDELARHTRAERLLVLDAAGDVPTILSLPDGARVDERDGLQLSIAFDPVRLTAAQLLAAISAQVDVVEISLAEPQIEDLVRQIYEGRA